MTDVAVGDNTLQQVELAGGAHSIEPLTVFNCKIVTIECKKLQTPPVKKKLATEIRQKIGHHHHFVAGSVHQLNIE